VTATTTELEHLELHQRPVRQTLALARRSIVGRLRQPAVLAPSILFPLFFCALSASTFSRIKDAPGFPKADSFLQFAVAGAIIQAMFFGATSSAADLATDIDQGFWERLIASPVRRSSIVLGRLASATVLGAFQAALFLVIFAIAGVRIRSGPFGALAIVISATLIALAIASVMAMFAIRSGSPEVVQGAFPLVFMLMFLSSTFMPRQLMHGWFHTVASLNPVSYLAEGMRSLILRPELQPGTLLKAWGIPAAGALLGLALCLQALRRRLAQS
jgi:ABC-2 type transport system permease protein